MSRRKSRHTTPTPRGKTHTPPTQKHSHQSRQRAMGPPAWSSPHRRQALQLQRPSQLPIEQLRCQLEVVLLLHLQSQLYAHLLLHPQGSTACPPLCPHVQSSELPASDHANMLGAVQQAAAAAAALELFSAGASLRHFVTMAVTMHLSCTPRCQGRDGMPSTSQWRLVHCI